MEELFDSLLSSEMPETGIKDILSDKNVDAPVNTDEDVLAGENLNSATQFVDNTFGTSAFNSDDTHLFNVDPIHNTTDSSEYMHSETSVAESEADTLGASVGVADSFSTTSTENNFLNPVDTPELEVSNDDIELLRDKASGIEREVFGDSITFKRKVCPTRHGCSGATYCDSCGSDYPY